MFPKDEGDYLIALCINYLQLPHSRDNMAKEGKYSLEQLNAFSSYGIPSI